MLWKWCGEEWFPIKASLFIRNQAVMKTLALEKFNGQEIVNDWATAVALRYIRTTSSPVNHSWVLLKPGGLACLLFQGPILVPKIAALP